MYEKQLGEKIKKLRNDKGLSQEKFALLIDMDRTYFATVEMGKRNVSLHNIEKIANGLGISLTFLLRAEGYHDIIYSVLLYGPVGINGPFDAIRR